MYLCKVCAEAVSTFKIWVKVNNMEDEGKEAVCESCASWTPAVENSGYSLQMGVKSVCASMNSSAIFKDTVLVTNPKLITTLKQAFI